MIPVLAIGLIGALIADSSSVALNPRLPLDPYDKVIVAFSGGKDSLACVLHLLDLGVPREKIELWHHMIDPADRPFMDWPATPPYCLAVARALGIPILFSGKVGGFEREMLREQSPTAPVWFETPDGTTMTVGGTGPEGTRLKFPQVSPNLAVRWCSAYLKIDVAARVLTNDPRLKTGRFILVTGERAEESPNRARYNEVETHRANTRNRVVLQWRPVLRWDEEQIWDIIRRYGVVPHPAYQLGWGRLSCMSCIFGDPNQWASVEAIAPDIFEMIMEFERRFNTTIKREGDLRAFIARRTPKYPEGGKSFVPAGAEAIIQRALSDAPWSAPVIIPPDQWQLPAGAFKRGGGPS